MTQNTWILQALSIAPLTALEALEGCGCFRLAARISELKHQGVPINTKIITVNGKKIAQYSRGNHGQD